MLKIFSTYVEVIRVQYGRLSKLVVFLCLHRGYSIRLLTDDSKPYFFSAYAEVIPMTAQTRKKIHIYSTYVEVILGSAFSHDTRHHLLCTYRGYSLLSIKSLMIRVFLYICRGYSEVHGSMMCTQIFLYVNRGYS